MNNNSWRSPKEIAEEQVKQKQLAEERAKARKEKERNDKEEGKKLLVTKICNLQVDYSTLLDDLEEMVNKNRIKFEVPFSAEDNFERNPYQALMAFRFEVLLQFNTLLKGLTRAEVKRELTKHRNREKKEFLMRCNNSFEVFTSHLESKRKIYLHATRKDFYERLLRFLNELPPEKK